MSIQSVNFQRAQFPQIEKTRISRPQQPLQKETVELKQASSSTSPSSLLSTEEKQFFSQLFSADAKQFANYQKNGGTSSSTLGTIIDRKG